MALSQSLGGLLRFTILTWAGADKVKKPMMKSKMMRFIFRKYAVAKKRNNYAKREELNRVC